MAPSSIRSLVVAAACALTIAFLPVSAVADDAARIRNLESEIQKLRAQLGEQDRRIQRLEAELERRAGASAPDWKPSRPAEAAAAGNSKGSGPLPWQSLKAWDRIAKGMSQEEVSEILGEPTAIESVDDYKTLFYHGPAADGGTISGHVNLRDDRVVAINKPAARE